MGDCVGVETYTITPVIECIRRVAYALLAVKTQGANMRKVTLIVGLNDKDSKLQEINTLDAYKIVARVVARDCTITEGRGVYTHEDGTIVEEVSLKIEMLDFDNSIDKEWLTDKIDELKTVLNQEAIVVEDAEVNSKLF